MATKFTFPKAPRVGDRVEIVSISEEKMPIDIVGNSEAGKELVIIAPGGIWRGASDGETVIASIENVNKLYTFKCVATKEAHMWLLEGTILEGMISELAQRVTLLEQKAGITTESGNESTGDTSSGGNAGDSTGTSGSSSGSSSSSGPIFKRR